MLLVPNNAAAVQVLDQHETVKMLKAKLISFARGKTEMVPWHSTCDRIIAQVNSGCTTSGVLKLRNYELFLWARTFLSFL